MARFTWDERKNRANRPTHGISFEAATRVFRDLFVIFDQDREVYGETRWQAIGRVGDVVVLLVAHTYEEYGDEDSEETIRIISARRAERHEQDHYYRENSL